MQVPGHPVAMQPQYGSNQQYGHALALLVIQKDDGQMLIKSALHSL